MRIGRTERALASVTMMSLAFSLIALKPASAVSGGVSIGAAAASSEASAGSDELSTARRHYRYRHGGNAGAARAFGAIAGTIGGIVAAEQARRYYRRHYYAQPYYAPYGYYEPYGYYKGYGW